MKTILKYAGAVLAGLVGGVLLIAGIQRVSSTVYPLPEGLDFNDRAAMSEYVGRLPVGAFLFVLGSYAAGTLAGVALARRLAPSRSAIPGIIVLVLLLGAGLMNVAMIPHPLWFTCAAVAVFLLFGAAGLRLAARRPLLAAG